MFPKQMLPAILLLAQFIKVYLHSFFGRMKPPGFQKMLFLISSDFPDTCTCVHFLFPHLQDQKKILTIYDNCFKDMFGVLITCPILSLRATSSEDQMQVAVGKSDLCQTPQTPRLRSCSPSPLLYTNCLSLSHSWG